LSFIEINLVRQISSIFHTNFYYFKGASETGKFLEWLQTLSQIFRDSDIFKSKSSLLKSPKSFPKRKTFSYTFLLILMRNTTLKKEQIGAVFQEGVLKRELGLPFILFH